MSGGFLRSCASWTQLIQGATHRGTGVDDAGPTRVRTPPFPRGARFPGGRRAAFAVGVGKLGLSGVGAQQSTPQQLPAGHFQEAEDEKEARSDVYWTERIYTLTLDNDTSQLFWSALQQGQVVLSVGYAFMADGVANEAPQVKLTGPAELTDALRARIDAGSTDPRQRPAFAIRAGAFAVTVDAIKWPDLFKRGDINERMPPGYAALDVYCYDFQKQEAGIYEKRVDIEADGVGGRPVSIQARFQRKQPDIYARSLRFPFAVRLDRPYRYRVVTILSDGRIQETPWQVRTSWTQLLDVTATTEGHVDDDPDRQLGAGK